MYIGSEAQTHSKADSKYLKKARVKIFIRIDNQNFTYLYYSLLRLFSFHHLLVVVVVPAIITSIPRPFSSLIASVDMLSYIYAAHTVDFLCQQPSLQRLMVLHAVLCV